MARKNKMGTSFCGLDLEDDEENKIKRFLKLKEISAKNLLRNLLRKLIRDEKLT